MSIFSTIDKDAKLLVSKIEVIFTKLFGSAPAVLQTVSATLTVVAPLVESILALTGNEAAAATILVVVSQVESDITAVDALVQSTGATPTLTSVLTAIVSNLKTLLTAGDIKDAATLSKVTAIVDTIVAEFEAILSALSASK